MPYEHVGKKLILEIPADLFFSASVRDFAKDMFELAKFDSTWQNKLKLVVDELFMNAVKYGSNLKKNVYLTFEILDNGVVFIIEDTGTGSGGITVEQLRRKIEMQKQNNNITKTSGRGLAMFTEKWSDEFDIDPSEHGGTKITFVKFLPKQSVFSAEQKAIEYVKKGNEIRVSFEGEIDQFTLDQNISKVDEVLKQNISNTQVIFDFEKVKYINSSFIGRIAYWFNTLQKNNSVLKITNVNDDIFEILDLVGLTKLIVTERNKPDQSII